MMDIDLYIKTFGNTFVNQRYQYPWELTAQVPSIVRNLLKDLSSEYEVHNEVAIHKEAIVEEHVILKGPIIIAAGCFIGAHAYLRGGVFLHTHVTVGPGCEIKSSMVMAQSSLAHFNFVGDSILGSHVNMEAGAVVANHYNERKEKEIRVLLNNQVMATGVNKFGALVGDQTKIGANAVLSPGTMLMPHSVVKRLELIEQVK